MKTIITLTRLYKKEVKFQLDPMLVIGKSREEIGEYLCSFDSPINYEASEDLFNEAEIEIISTPHNADEVLEDVVGDRFDIESDKGVPLYGGHL